MITKVFICISFLPSVGVSELCRVAQFPSCSFQCLSLSLSKSSFSPVSAVFPSHQLSFELFISLRFVCIYANSFNICVESFLSQIHCCVTEFVELLEVSVLFCLRVASRFVKPSGAGV